MGSQANPEKPFASWLVMAINAGIVAGLIEGVGLLAFQRINWERWGPMVHVSAPIIWISPVVDVCFFVFASGIVWLAVRAIRQVPSLRIPAFLLAFLSVYDWLTLTGRLHHLACILLALGIAVTLSRWVAKHDEKVRKVLQTSLPALAFLFLVAFVAIQGGRWWNERSATANLPPANPRSPNIVVIVVDTLRADHLSSYGYSLKTTPNLDRIAQEGVLFENAFSACSWTLPSHASLLTGRYPSDHGMENVQPMPWLGWGDKALQGYPTLGSVLEKNGYRTAAFSANQIYFTSNVGLGRGFIHFEDYFQSAQDMFLRTLYGRELDRIYLRRSEKSLVTRTLRRWAPRFLNHHKEAGEVNREALAWIDRDRRPFLAFLNYIDVHDVGTARWTHSAQSTDISNFIRDYDSALRYVDKEIGQLLEELDRRGLAENTLVVITSDHGESLGQHHMQFHGIALYLEQIHVPLLLYYPGHLPAGRRIQTPVSNASIAATVMGFVAPGDRTFPGGSLKILWENPEGETNWPHPRSEVAKNQIVIEPDGLARNLEPTALDGDMRSVITPQWHFIQHQSRGDQLYDWVDDDGETRELLNANPGAAESLKKELATKAAP